MTAHPDREGNKIRLIVEIHGSTARAVNALAGLLSDYADEQFEQGTMEGKPLSFMRSWIVKPKRDGQFR